MGGLVIVGQDSKAEWTGYSGTERLGGLVMLCFENEVAEKLNIEQTQMFRQLSTTTNSLRLFFVTHSDENM